MDNQIIFGVTDEQSGYKDEILLTNMSNRHGCITGATGTGKTVSLQKLAESFSKKGVPVFLADIKGDLSGIAKAAVPTDKLKARLEIHYRRYNLYSGMSRTIKEIYNEAVQERNRRLELTEFASDSKLSVMNGILWTVAAVIYSFETLLDVFAVDISEAINNRINGTPDYYANALLQYQQGDELTVREDGLAFGYAQVDETKRIITQVSYVESTDDSNLDSKLVLKIATGTKGHLEAIPAEELVPINAYIGKLKFAGTRIEVISTKGDVLVPRLTVFYDGAVPEAEMYDSIETRIRDYIMGIDFDAAVYVSRLTDAIRRAEHVTDVYIDETAIPEQGVFIACHDTDGQIQPLQRVGRMTYTASGYLKESSRKDEESELPTFREAITLKVENHEI